MSDTFNNTIPHQPSIDGKNIPGFSDISPDKIPDGNIEIVIPPVNILPTEHENSTSDAIRVIFLGDDPYLTYNFARTLLVSVEDFKFFVIAFDTIDASLVAPIQIPIIGQTIGEISDEINKFPGLKAEVLNGYENVSASLLLDKECSNITRNWGYLQISSVPSDTAIINNDILVEYYYTSVEPGIEQSNPIQSIGGYVSSTKIQVSSYLNNTISFYDTVLPFVDSDINKYSIISCKDEILLVEKWEGNVAYIASRGAYGTPKRHHAFGSKFYGVCSENLLNETLSKDYKQYRCIAVRNISDFALSDVKVFIKISSRNIASIARIAVEIPRFEQQSFIASSGSSSGFVVSSIAGLYADDYFKAGFIRFTSANEGQSRIVSSYKGSTGEFLLESPLPFPVGANDSILLDTCPSQRVKSGIHSPTANDVLISSFQEAMSINDAVDINVNEQRNNGSNMLVNDVFYVWLERAIEPNNERFDNNITMISVTYKK